MIGVAAFLFGQANAVAGDLPRLIKRVRNVYKTCRTYRDAGFQTISVQDKNGKQTIWGERSFSTFFVRPGLLRFELSEPTKDPKRSVTSVLWTVKGTAPTKASINDPLKPTPYPVSIYIGFDGSLHPNNDFLAAISSFASLSGGIADKVPSMLLPSNIMLDYLAQTDLRLVGSEKIGTYTCSVLSSKELAMSFWFDKQTGLLIKLREANDFGDGRSSIKVTQYIPKVNTPIRQSDIEGPKGGLSTKDKPLKEAANRGS